MCHDIHPCHFYGVRGYIATYVASKLLILNNIFSHAQVDLWLKFHVAIIHYNKRTPASNSVICSYNVHIINMTIAILYSIDKD